MTPNLWFSRPVVRAAEYPNVEGLTIFSTLQVVVKAGHPKLASVKLTKNFASPDCTAKVCLLFFISLYRLWEVQLELSLLGEVPFCIQVDCGSRIFFRVRKSSRWIPDRKYVGTKDDQFQVLSGLWYEAVRLNIQPQGQTNKA
jgi:hypothetical protein